MVWPGAFIHVQNWGLCIGTCSPCLLVDSARDSKARSLLVDWVQGSTITGLQQL